jgi:hypothetical protein
LGALPVATRSLPCSKYSQWLSTVKGSPHTIEFVSPDVAELERDEAVEVRGVKLELPGAVGTEEEQSALSRESGM